MTKKELKKYFEEKYLKNSCFDNLKDLLTDHTLYQVNAPRALIACNLKGAWTGLNDPKEIK